MSTHYTQAEQDIINNAKQIIRERAPIFGDTLDCSTKSADLMRLELAGAEREKLAVAFLNNQNAVISVEIMFEGTVDRAVIYPREIMRRALALNACALILGHNHPGGVAKPSEADNYFTDNVKKACALLDIRLLDHVIVTDTNGFYSYAESRTL